MDGNRYSITSDYENVDWTKVIPILIAFAHKLLSKQKFRNNEREQMAADFASEAIMKYLENKENFNPARNPDLILYLKYNILRQIISNYSKSGDNKTVSDKKPEDLLFSVNIIEELPIDESIDTKDIVSKIQKEINHDELMSLIFDAKYEENMKRAEICQFLSIDTSTYDNAMKRLRRIVEKHIN